ncbi:hypothetical protein [Amphibacillus indicireducens]|uniref:Uncharacterized protein n=1 Tax=Amphibacillus indicireducens TaxID=1076330 RepID=A0ABP7VSQ4_9BACI
MIKNKFFMLITIGFLLVVTGCSTGETEPVDQAEDIEGLEVIEELPTELKLDLDDYLDLL